MQRENGSNKKRMTRRVRWLLFAGSFISFAWFNQGGGWNQNSRFAMVRSVVERGELSIDSYLIYVQAPNGPPSRFNRVPIRNAEYETDGQTNILLWKSKTGQFFPVSDALEGDVASGFLPGAAYGW